MYSNLSIILLSAALQYGNIYQVCADEKILTTCTSSVESECVNYDDSAKIDDSDEAETHYLADWINAEGGFVDSRQEIRRLFPDDPHSPKGVFAKERIEKGQLLLSVPWKLLIRSEMDEEKEMEEDDLPDDWNCQLVDSLSREMALGDESKFAPYIHYLNGQERGQILGDFSTEAQLMLNELTDSIISTFDVMTSIESLQQRCSREDPVAVHASVLIEQRSEDDLMIPYYDMYNHRNGKWLNTWINLVRGEKYDVLARHTIEAGQEIYNSYNQCNKCAAKAYNFECGTPHIFDLYGFTESYPQRWAIGADFFFDLDQEDSGKIVLSWSNKEDLHIQEDLDILKNMISRLQVSGDRYKRDGIASHPQIKQSEWNTIFLFYDALSVALDNAFLSTSDFVAGGNGYY